MSNHIVGWKSKISGYPYGLEIHTSLCVEIHGPYVDEAEAMAAGQMLMTARGVRDIESMKVVKIETPGTGLMFLRGGWLRASPGSPTGWAKVDDVCSLCGELERNGRHDQYSQHAFNHKFVLKSAPK